MIDMATTLTFESSPHIRTNKTVACAMYHVLLALVPAVACSIYFFGLPALYVLLTSVISCMAVEWFVTSVMFKRKCTLADGSAALTGVLLALNLPSIIPLWMVVAGAVMAIGVAKMAFGGLGCNIFNPALVGRVFLLISFPVAMTSWPVVDGVTGASWINPDGVTGATFLSMVKTGGIDPTHLPISNLLTGEMSGSMGEVSTIALIAGFVYLLAVRVIKWLIPVSIIAGLAVVDIFAGYPVYIDILTGGLLLGTIFMATDYVTSPMTKMGMLVYGLIIGALTAVIRRWGAYPEGMSFAILIMNGFTPLINRYMRPRRYSPRRKEAVA